MKATGIIRRIDDLGRVVIPKEIRRTLKIREGDPLELYTDKDGCVIFKRYQPDNFGEVANQIKSAIQKCGLTCGVYDRDGDAITAEPIPHKDIEETDECVFTMRDEWRDVILYVVTKVPANDNQKAHIEGVLSIAGLNLA